MKLSLYNVREIEELSKVLDQCRGDVELVTPQGQELSWKQSREFVKAWAEALPGKNISEIGINVSDQRDVPSLIKYMMRRAS